VDVEVLPLKAPLLLGATSGFSPLLSFFCFFPFDGVNTQGVRNSFPHPLSFLLVREIVCPQSPEAHPSKFLFNAWGPLRFYPHGRFGYCGRHHQLSVSCFTQTNKAGTFHSCRLELRLERSLSSVLPYFFALNGRVPQPLFQRDRLSRHWSWPPPPPGLADLHPGMTSPSVLHS